MLFQTEIIIGIILLLCVIIFYIFAYNKYDSFTGSATITSQLKIIKYFGGSYCIYSNKSSAAYMVIKDFEEKYKDVKVEYYWVGTNDDMMAKHTVTQVPTILNSNNVSIELNLPKDTDTTNKTTEQLKELLLSNIYTQL